MEASHEEGCVEEPDEREESSSSSETRAEGFRTEAIATDDEYYRCLGVEEKEYQDPENKTAGCTDKNSDVQVGSGADFWSQTSVADDGKVDQT